MSLRVGIAQWWAYHKAEVLNSQIYWFFSRKYVKDQIVIALLSEDTEYKAKATSLCFVDDLGILI